MSGDKDNKKSKPNKAPSNAQNNNVVVPPVIVCKENGGDAATQGIRFVFSQTAAETDLSQIEPILAETIPFKTNVGDRVKLDAMVQVNVITREDGPFATRSTDFSIDRATQLLGQNTPTVETIVRVRVHDGNVNNTPSGNSYTRLVSITWVDTPPAGISTYTFRVSGSGQENIESVTFSNRALNAIIFPIGSSLI